MYHLAWKCGTRCVARLCGGISHPLASIKRSNLGPCLGQLGAPVHVCSGRPRPWRQPPSLQLSIRTQQQQHRCLFSCAAGFSSLSTAAELSAAIATAHTGAELQSLAAAAASTPHQAWLVQQYKVQLMSGLEEESPASLIKTLAFFAKLGPGHQDIFEQAVPVLYNQLGQMTPTCLLDLLSAYAAAAAHSPSAYSHELFAALTEFLWEGVNDLDARGLADIAAGYAASNHFDDDDDFFGGVAAAALHKLESFCPEDLSRLLLSFAQLRFAAPQLNAAALAQMAAQLDAWPLSCIGKTLHALATVQAPVDPCVLERVANHVSHTLRNLRTSTDGKQLLASLSNGTRGRAGKAACADGVAAAAAVGLPAGLSGLAGSTVGSNTRMNPSWKGFGATRSSSSSSSSSSVLVEGNSSSATFTSSSSSSTLEGAASIWAAANTSSSMYEYAELASPPSGVTHVLDQECELGPDYITVTSYGPDGHTTTTYIKKAAAGSKLGLDAIGRSLQSNTSPGPSTGTSSGVRPPPGARALTTTSRRGGWQLPGPSNPAHTGGNGYNSRVDDDGCPTSWQWQTISSDCRPVYDDAPALQGAIVDVLWGMAMLGHLHSNMAKECFKALALVQAESLSDTQLIMLWSAHMRYQQLGHVVLDPNPLLAESYSAFYKEVSRAAPRTLALPANLQTVAAGQWLLNNIRHSPEYQQQQQQDSSALMSWKYRDPAVLTQQGLEASVRQALQQLGLPVGSPCVTLDGLERVGLPLKHNGVCMAWQVIPPAWCTRNAPHTPTVEAAAQRWALQYRGYTVLQVPFHEWASVLESGDSLVQAGYLQQMLDRVTSVRAPHVPNF